MKRFELTVRLLILPAVCCGLSLTFLLHACSTTKVRSRLLVTLDRPGTGRACEVGTVAQSGAVPGRLRCWKSAFLEAAV